MSYSHCMEVTGTAQHAKQAGPGRRVNLRARRHGSAGIRVTVSSANMQAYLSFRNVQNPVIQSFHGVYSELSRYPRHHCISVKKNQDIVKGKISLTLPYSASTITFSASSGVSARRRSRQNAGSLVSRAIWASTFTLAAAASSGAMRKKKRCDG